MDPIVNKDRFEISNFQIVDNLETYNYWLLDPRKPGKYSYEGLNFCFLYEPFYTGISTKGIRFSQHLNDAYNFYDRHNKFKNRLIRKIKNKTNKDPYFIVTNENNIWASACELEKFYIKMVGRRDRGLGPLTNLTDGGDGTFGIIPLNRIDISEIKNKIIQIWKNLFDISKIEVIYTRTKNNWETIINNIYCNIHNCYFNTRYRSLINEKKNSCKFCNSDKCRDKMLGKRYSLGLKKSEEEKARIKITQNLPHIIELKTRNAIKYNYKVINIDGDVFETNNLKLFCKNNNIHCSHLQETFKGKRRKHTKGWKIIERNPI